VCSAAQTAASKKELGARAADGFRRGALRPARLLDMEVAQESRSLGRPASQAESWAACPRHQVGTGRQRADPPMSCQLLQRRARTHGANPPNLFYDWPIAKCQLRSLAFCFNCIIFCQPSHLSRMRGPATATVAKGKAREIKDADVDVDGRRINNSESAAASS